MVDIWSCGIVLYAMLCGYLPFEDPDTKKLYKKILKGNFELPKFLSDSAKDLLRKILNTNPETRYQIEDIRRHPWYSLSKPKESIGEVTVIDSNLLLNLKDFDIDPEVAKRHLEANKHNEITATYYLLLNKKRKEKMEIPTLGENESVKKVVTSSEMENKPLNSTADTANTIQPFIIEDKAHNISWLENYNLNIERLSETKKQIPKYKIVPKSQVVNNVDRIASNASRTKPIINKPNQRTSSQSPNNRDIQTRYVTEQLKDDFVPKDHLSLIPEIAAKHHKWPLEVLVERNFQPKQMHGIYKKIVSQARTQQPILTKGLDRTQKVPKAPTSQKMNLSDYATRRTNRFIYSRRTGARPEIRSRKGTADRTKRFSEGRQNDRIVYAKVPLTSTIINFNIENLSLEHGQEIPARKFRLRKYNEINNYSMGN